MVKILNADYIRLKFLSSPMRGRVRCAGLVIWEVGYRGTAPSGEYT